MNVMSIPTFRPTGAWHSPNLLKHYGFPWKGYDEPGGPRSNTLYRDQFSGDDLFSIVIDSYNDYETGVWFTANPAGVRSDRTVSNDAQFSSGMPMNNDRNAHWDLATTESDEGWSAETKYTYTIK